MEGLIVEKLLKEKLWSSSNIVGLSAADIRTTICQNKCSDHGVCNSQTRACMCETFWMPSLYYFWGNGQANCGKALFVRNISKIFSQLVFFVYTDWSILYVVIAVFILFISILSLCWAMNCFCRTSKPRTRTKTQRYALLESQEHEVPTRKFKYLKISLIHRTKLDCYVSKIYALVDCSESNNVYVR